jgi:hypothetical protein
MMKILDIEMRGGGDDGKYAVSTDTHTDRDMREEERGSSCRERETSDDDEVNGMLMMPSSSQLSFVLISYNAIPLTRTDSTYTRDEGRKEMEKERKRAKICMLCRKFHSVQRREKPVHQSVDAVSSFLCVSLSSRSCPSSQ